MNHEKYNLKWLLGLEESGHRPDYLFFWGHSGNNPKAAFSQWHPSPFIVDGITYPTTEHWMMAHKALLFDNHQLYTEILNTEKPGAAKELGRKITGFDEHIWNAHKRTIVYNGNLHKFSQHHEAAQTLLATGQKVLVEASPADIIWGIGLAENHIHAQNVFEWRGQNLLGFILMEVRDYLREKG
jgi:hypothetical protein